MSNVSVCVRFRPLNAKEFASASQSYRIRRRDDQSFDFKDDKEGEITFSFDRVFYEDSNQAEVFDFVAMPIVKDAMNAINGTVLAYGQTGAGKTYSMEGTNTVMDDPKLQGILPRVAQCIFEHIETAEPTIEFIIKLSMVEIYMEKIRDLFDSTKDNLQVKEDKTRGIFVAGVSEVYIQTEQEMLKLLKAGISNRAVGATRIPFTYICLGVPLYLSQPFTEMNAHSSRSHCVFMVSIQQTNIEDRSVKTGKLFLVDLAGSEKLEKTCAEGKLLTEAKTINKSLSALGNVINALTTERTYHVPYRDSRLTRILQESLGGNSRTTLLCCCSSSSFNLAETLSTLRFGLRAKEIKNKPKVNAERSRYELEQMLARAEAECEQLRSQLIMLNARIHSLTGDENGTLNLVHQVASPECMNSIEKLKLVLSSKKTPNLDEIIEVIKQIFEEEGLVSNDFDAIGNDCTMVINEDLLKSVTVLQNIVEELADSFDKVTREKESLETELLAHQHLSNSYQRERSGSKLCESLSFGMNFLSKARVIRPLRGGTHGLLDAQSASSGKLQLHGKMVHPQDMGHIPGVLLQALGWWSSISWLGRNKNSAGFLVASH